MLIRVMVNSCYLENMFSKFPGLNPLSLFRGHRLVYLIPLYTDLLFDIAFIALIYAYFIYFTIIKLIRNNWKFILLYLITCHLFNLLTLSSRFVVTIVFYCILYNHVKVVWRCHSLILWWTIGPNKTWSLTTTETLIMLVISTFWAMLHYLLIVMLGWQYLLE